MSNPPFSQFHEWLGKAVAEVKMGKRIIFLMSQLSYFKQGKARKKDMLRWHEEINIKLISWCDGPRGFVHSPKWAPNEITGKPGGPQFGSVILDMTPR